MNFITYEIQQLGRLFLVELSVVLQLGRKTQ